MNTKHTLLGIALIMPLASFAQSEVQPNEKKDTIADQEIKEVTVVSRKAGVSRLAGAINGSIINKDELFKAYTLLSAQITRWFRHFSIYLGGENLTGFKQKHPVVDAMNPWGSQFDTNMVWGPINGAMGYIGIRVNFGRL